MEPTIRSLSTTSRRCTNTCSVASSSEITKGHAGSRQQRMGQAKSDLITPHHTTPHHITPPRCTRTEQASVFIHSRYPHMQSVTRYLTRGVASPRDLSRRRRCRVCFGFWEGPEIPWQRPACRSAIGHRFSTSRFDLNLRRLHTLGGGVVGERRGTGVAGGGGGGGHDPQKKGKTEKKETNKRPHKLQKP